jgi:hypothetical protein
MSYSEENENNQNSDIPYLAGNVFGNAACGGVIHRIFYK